MPVTENPTTCPKHPNVETALRCASCNTLICPKCMVHTPVGYKCKSCAHHTSGQMFSLTPIPTLAAAFVGIIAGAVAALVSDKIGFLTVFLALIYGPFAGEMILRASGRKRGSKMEILTGVSMSAGVVLALVLVGIIGGQGALNSLLDMILPLPIPLAAVVIAISTAVSRIRYL